MQRERREKGGNNILYIIIYRVQGSPFGSTSVRTLPLHKKDDIYTPGPAHYQDTNQSTEKHDRFSHSFASKTKRLYSPPAIVAVRIIVTSQCESRVTLAWLIVKMKTNSIVSF